MGPCGHQFIESLSPNFSSGIDSSNKAMRPLKELFIIILGLPFLTNNLTSPSINFTRFYWLFFITWYKITEHLSRNIRRSLYSGYFVERTSARVSLFHLYCFTRKKNEFEFSGSDIACFFLRRDHLFLHPQKELCLYKGKSRYICHSVQVRNNDFK